MLNFGGQKNFMEKYVQYLLTDIRAAAAYHPALPTDPDEDFDFLPPEEEEKYAPRRPLFERLDLRPEWFPPGDRLTDEQMERLLMALEDCLENYGFFAIFPERAPVRRRYELLTQKLTDDVPILQHNVWQIEFCEFDPVSCPFDADHCRCREFEAMLRAEEEAEEEDYDVFDFEWEEDLDWADEEDMLDDEDDFLGFGLDISGYDMPELVFGPERFGLWSEDEIDLHDRFRQGESKEDEERSSDQFAPPDFDPDEEEGEE